MTDKVPYEPYDPSEDALKLMFTWESVKGKNYVKPEPMRFCSQAAARFFPVTFKNKVYLFDTEKRLYFEETNTIKQWARRQITRMSELIQKKQTRPLTPEEEENGSKVQPLYYSLPTAQKISPILRDVQEQVAAVNVIEGDKFPFNQYNGIAVKNGVIEFDESGMFSLHERTHHHMFTRCIPVEFNPGADTTRVIEVLKQWLPEDDYNWLVQIPAQALMQSLPNVAPFKQSYLCIGDPNSAKSSLSNLMQKMVGTENFATHMLHELGDNFLVASLPYKYFCWGDDLPYIQIDASNKFKTLTGKRSMMVNPKFCHPYEAEITAVFCFCSNYAPQLAQSIIDDSGWWDRWAIIRFTGKFEKDPTWEERTFTKEFIEGMLLLAVLEVGSIISNHGKLRLRQESDKVKNYWICDANLFHEMFFETYIEKTDDDYFYIGKQELCDGINDWIRRKEYTLKEGMTENQFLERIPRTIPAITVAMRNQGVNWEPTHDDYGKIIRPYMKVRWKHSTTALSWCHPTPHSKL